MPMMHHKAKLECFATNRRHLAAQIEAAAQEAIAYLMDPNLVDGEDTNPRHIIEGGDKVEGHGLSLQTKREWFVTSPGEDYKEGKSR